MNQVLDPFNLILLAIALVVFWRLRSVLGSRTGNERPPFDPYGANGSDKTVAAEAANGNVIRLPKDGDAAEVPRRSDEEQSTPVWAGFAVEGSPVAKGLEKIVQSDPSFAPRAFLDGAKVAYEMILEAFAEADKPALKNLLSRDVYEGFAKAIDAREAAGQKLESRFVGIGKAEFVSVDLTGQRAAITVKFVSELISATRDKDGTVVEGDPKQIRETTDVWTFERDVNSRDPNWKLVATEEPA